MARVLNLQYLLIIIFFFIFINETDSRPRVLKCNGDCGVIDESAKYSAVARLCYGSGNDRRGSDVTFIEDDIIITQAHVFGNPNRIAPCCGGDCEKKAEDWKKAIEDDNLPWTHISNLKFWQDPIAQEYNIRSIPATFILDENGKIIAKDLRGEALNEKIASLLN